MASRKQVVKDRADLANVVTKFEKGKSQVKVGDVREVLRILVGIEAAGYVKGHKSVFMMMRKESVALGKKAKKAKKAK